MHECGHARAPVVDKLATAVAQTGRAPALREKFVGLSFQAVGSTPPEYGDFLKKQIET